MHEHIANPDHLKTVFAFPYRGMKITITTAQHEQRWIFTAWVDYATGSAVAVPRAASRNEAIRRAKKWIHRQFDLGDRVN